MKQIDRKQRGPSLSLSMAAALCTAAMLIAYSLAGTNPFTPVLSSLVLTLLGVCTGLSVLLTIWEVKNGKYALFLLLLWAWLEFFAYEASYISNVFVGIDGNFFDAGFLLTAGFGLLGCGCALAAAVLQRDEYHGPFLPAAQGKEAV